MNWLGSYVIRFVKNAGDVQLDKLNGEVVKVLVNYIKMKLYRDNHTSTHYYERTVCVP
jgi:hypothetical protein